jgi:hypothetical protein
MHIRVVAEKAEVSEMWRKKSSFVNTSLSHESRGRSVLKRLLAFSVNCGPADSVCLQDESSNGTFVNEIQAPWVLHSASIKQWNEDVYVRGGERETETRDHDRSRTCITRNVKSVVEKRRSTPAVFLYQQTLAPGFGMTIFEQERCKLLNSTVDLLPGAQRL